VIGSTLDPDAGKGIEQEPCLRLITPKYSSSGGFNMEIVMGIILLAAVGVITYLALDATKH